MNRPIAVVGAPSSIGIRPYDDGEVRQLSRAPDVLRERGLIQRLGGDRPGRRAAAAVSRLRAASESRAQRGGSDRVLPVSRAARGSCHSTWAFRPGAGRRLQHRARLSARGETDGGRSGGARVRRRARRLRHAGRIEDRIGREHVPRARVRARGVRRSRGSPDVRRSSKASTSRSWAVGTRRSRGTATGRSRLRRFWISLTQSCSHTMPASSLPRCCDV